jgi:ABC-type transporter Mla subunit MlaD
MAEAQQSGGIGDFFSALSGVNPFAGVQRSVAQFQQGVTSALATIEKLNVTLDQFNRIATRVNDMLDAVEGPMTTLVPGLNQLATSLTSPPMVNLSDDLGDFLKILGDLGRRMQPLTQLAESAGGMFNRSFSNLFPGGQRGAPAPAAPRPTVEPRVATPTQRPSSIVRPSPPARPSPPELEPATGAAVTSTSARRAAPKRAAPKKTATTKRPAARKAAAVKKPAAKRAAPRKSTKR